MNFKKIKIFYWFFTFLLFIVMFLACKTIPHDINECFKPDMTKSVVSWGEINVNDSIQTDYILSSNGNLKKSVTAKNKQVITDLGYLKTYQSCRILKFFKVAMNTM